MSLYAHHHPSEFSLHSSDGENVYVTQERLDGEIQYVKETFRQNVYSAADVNKAVNPRWR
jgi:hypothetical protein